MLRLEKCITVKKKNMQNSDFFNVLLIIFGVFCLFGCLGYAFINRHHYFHEFMKERKRKHQQNKNNR